MKRASAILDFLLAAATRGEQTALVTITDVIGSSSRVSGTHMAISETGAFVGSFSGGCVEAAVVGEAKRIIASGKSESIRFGIDSPFIDIRLPCGGGIDMLFIPNPDVNVIRQTLRSLVGRRISSLALSLTDGIALDPAVDRPTGWYAGTFIVRHEPDLRLIIAGHGAEVLAVARLAKVYGAEVSVLSPDDAIVSEVLESGAQAWKLASPSRSSFFRADPFSAVIFLFHDHDWEPALLEQALDSAAFFVGAMGSRRTHEQRLDTLRARGVPEASLRRLVGPLGLIPVARDPDTLALSALGQIVDRRERLNIDELTRMNTVITDNPLRRAVTS